MSGLTTIYINSKDRTSGTSTDFNYNIFPLGIGENKSFCIKNITIPFSYYATVPRADDGTDQRFQVTEDGFPSFFVDVPAGNYSTTQLSAELKNILDLASPAGNVYTITFDETTLKTNISAVGVNFTIQFDNSNIATERSYKRIGNILGWYDPNTKQTQNATPLNTIHTSPFSYNLSGPNCLYLKSSTLNLGSISFLNAKKNNVILEIPILSNTGGIIHYQDEQETYQPYDVNQTNYLDFKLVDEYDNTIDLNGLDFCFSVVIKNNSSF